MAAAFSNLRGAFAGISPRDRRLLIVLGCVLGIVLFAGLYYWSATALDEIEAERSAAVDALRTIRHERPRIRQRQLRREQAEARYANRAPPLTSFVEQAAHAATVTVAEAADRSSGVATGAHFQRRGVAIRLRQVNLQSLVAFMERLEGADFPIAITSVRISKRYNESNSYDVDDMVITTWDRVDAASNRTGAAAPRAAATGAAGSTVRATGAVRATGTGAVPARAVARPAGGAP